jgi:hypothetical protein
MKKDLQSVLYMLAFLSVLVFAAFSVLSAAEHPGKAIEHPGTAVQPMAKAITAAFVKKSIENHANDLSKAHGDVFMIHDDKLNKDWRLKLAKVHDPVRTFEKDGQTIYFACSDFNSVDSNDVLDIDFWMVRKGDKLEVTETKIHKLNGEPRYQYEGVRIKEIK